MEDIFNLIQQQNNVLICLLKENNKLKRNWNKLKDIVKSQKFLKNKCHYGEVWFEVDDLLNKMQDLEQGVIK